MPAWTDIIGRIHHARKTHGRHLEDPPPFGLKEAVKVLVEQQGYGAVEHALLEVRL